MEVRFEDAEIVLRKKVSPGGTGAGRVYVPRQWIDRTVAIVLLKKKGTEEW